MLVSIAEADTYFETRLGASECWTSGAEKTAALQTAEYDLIAVYGAVSNKQAVMEQALFRLQDPSMDRRASVRAQGVQSAGAVKESYAVGGGQTPVCPRARDLLGEPTAGLRAHVMETEDELVTYEL